ncbi:MAG: flagellar assembly protein FliH [Rhodospirillaceae bacterium]
MSEGIITGGRNAAYRPWQLASFDAPRPRGSMPTAAEMERVHQQARDEGHAAGYQEGRKLAEAQAQRLAALFDAARSGIAQLDQAIADRLLALALDIARRVVSEALSAKPELMLSVVQDAVRCLPEFEQPVRILMHPADAALVQSHLAAEASAGSWLIVPDAAMERGGCRLKTATAEVDATLSGRWQRVLAALGHDREWLAP